MLVKGYVDVVGSRWKLSLRERWRTQMGRDGRLVSGAASREGTFCEKKRTYVDVRMYRKLRFDRTRGPRERGRGSRFRLKMAKPF